MARRTSLRASQEAERGMAAAVQVWKTIPAFHFRPGDTHTDPFHPFDHPLVSWHRYSPSNRENYFGQVHTSFSELVWAPTHSATSPMTPCPTS